MRYDAPLVPEMRRMRKNYRAFDGVGGGVSAKKSIMWNHSMDTKPGVWAVSVTVKGHATIFPKIVGVLTLHEFNIIDARCFRDGEKILCSFKVRPLFFRSEVDDRLEKAKLYLGRMVDQDLNLALAISQKASCRSVPKPSSPPGIEMNNEKSYLYSLLEVEGDDFPGFLFMVSDVIVKSGLDICNARISTKRNRVSDVFYVKEKNGGKIETTDRILKMKARLRNAFKLLGRGTMPPYRTANI